jgi:hypothetical protein
MPSVFDDRPIPIRRMKQGTFYWNENKNIIFMKCSHNHYVVIWRNLAYMDDELYPEGSLSPFDSEDVHVPISIHQLVIILLKSLL